MGAKCPLTDVALLSGVDCILGVLRATIIIQLNRHPENASSEHKVFLAAKHNCNTNNDNICVCLLGIISTKHCVEDSPTKFSAIKVILTSSRGLTEVSFEIKSFGCGEETE